jgi:1-deoxy-D-xylulose-5-phosphate synthase
VELLGKINAPKDLRKLRRESLPQVALEVRNHILDVISQKGGHFASNLGTVELAVALHYAFETPADKLVWDVGHQGYPHKILTGRRDNFHTIRQHKGISGFLDRTESEYDHFGAGHASTSISAALGMAEGMRHGGLPHMAVAIIGDGSMTGGLAFEALNNAGHIPARNLVVVLNDNDMSIDPNVGALQKFINHRFTQPGYNRVRKELHGLVQSLNAHGVPVGGLASRIRKSVKTFFTPGMLFESLGFRYFGPIDGHDINELVEILSFIKSQGVDGGPYLVHAITKKGKGYKLAEELPLQYHGVSPFKIEDGIKGSSGKKKANYQDVFADTLIRLAKEDPRIVAVTAAMPSGTGVNKFQKEFPTRTYDVGIAEQHAVLFAAGLATEGFRPVAAIYSTFLQRAYDQIVHDVCLQKLPVFFAMDRAGLVGADGATHQGQFDLSYLRSLPNMVVMAPKDENELQHMIKTGVTHQQGPIAVRYPRGAVVGVAMDAEPTTLPIGRGEVVSADSDRPDVCLIGVGFTVQTALEAQKLLRAQGLTCAVINARFIKPLDEKLIQHWITSSRLAVTLEENTILGGFGSAVLEMLNRNGCPREVLTVGMPDRFVHHGTQEEQRAELGIDADGVLRRVMARLAAAKPELAPLPAQPSVPVYDANIPIQ